MPSSSPQHFDVRGPRPSLETLLLDLGTISTSPNAFNTGQLSNQKPEPLSEEVLAVSGDTYWCLAHGTVPGRERRSKEPQTAEVTAASNRSHAYREHCCLLPGVQSTPCGPGGTSSSLPRMPPAAWGDNWASPDLASPHQPVSSVHWSRSAASLPAPRASQPLPPQGSALAGTFRQLALPLAGSHLS